MKNISSTKIKHGRRRRTTKKPQKSYSSCPSSSSYSCSSTLSSSLNCSSSQSLSSNIKSSPLALTTTFVSILIASLILFGDPSIQIHFAPKLITRFCYNSPNLSTVNSQCVLCNYYMFDATVLGCTGSTALTMNITSTQAFCVISQCLGQVRQQPVFLGRRKRDNEKEEAYDEEKPSSTLNYDDKQWDVTNNSTRGQYQIAQDVSADVYDPYDPAEAEKYGPEEI